MYKEVASKEFDKFGSVVRTQVWDQVRVIIRDEINERTRTRVL